MPLPLPSFQTQAQAGPTTESSVIVPWKPDPEDSEHALIRPLFGLDHLLVCWNGWGGSEPIVAGTLDFQAAGGQDSDDVLLRALSKAIAATVHEVPDLAVRTVKREGDLHLQYKPFASEKELDAWIDKVIEIEEVDGSDVASAFENARQKKTAPGNLLSPVEGRNEALIAVTWLKCKNGQQQGLMLRGWHVLLDGLVILEVFRRIISNWSKALDEFPSSLPIPSFTGADAARLSPHALDCVPDLATRYKSYAPDQSAWGTFLSAKEFGFPLADHLIGKKAKWEHTQPPSRHHFRLSVDASQTLFKKIKAQGYTINTFYAAVQIVAVLRLLRAEVPAKDAEPITLPQLHTSNLRSFMTDESRVNTCSSAAEGLIAAADSKSWDEGLRKGISLDQLEEQVVWDIARQLKSSTARARKDPLEMACAATHGFWGQFNAAGDAIATGQLEK